MSFIKNKEVPEELVMAAQAGEAVHHGAVARPQAAARLEVAAVPEGAVPVEVGR